jgi:hypothetical protein
MLIAFIRVTVVESFEYSALRASILALSSVFIKSEALRIVIVLVSDVIVAESWVDVKRFDEIVLI